MTRRKKSILLYCPDRELLSTLAFTLRLHLYDVAAVHAGEDALALTARSSEGFACGVLIHARQGDPAGRLIHRLLESGARIPLLLVDRAGDLAPIRYVDMVLYGRNTTVRHILASLQVLCRRRPVPKSRRGM